ncbi:Serine/threonine-protein kinase Sgk1, partial [Fragariocoptes setiger]
MSYIKKEMIARINVILSKCHITNNNGLEARDDHHHHHHLHHHHHHHHHLNVNSHDVNDDVSDDDKIDLGSSERLHVIPHDFEFLKVIGKGSFGKVYLARHKLEAKIYAIKVLSKHMILKHNEKRHVMSERNVLIRNLRHPFLIGLHYSFQSKDKLYFVLDYANGGEMFYHLQRDHVFEESRARFYAAEITSALGYLHAEGIIYRDLKPENILLDSSGHLVLTDFGLCKEGIKDIDTTTTFCGTPEYLAPEVLRKEAYDRCVDWWCLGAVLYEMLFGLPPFFSQDRAEMYDNILHQPLKFRNNASIEARQILTGLLSKNKHTRLGFLGGADEVKRHEFFRSINWYDLEAKKICPPYNPEVHDQMDVRNIDPVFIAEPVPSSVCKQHSLGVTNSFPEDSFQGFSYAPSLLNK